MLFFGILWYGRHNKHIGVRKDDTDRAVQVWYELEKETLQAVMVGKAWGSEETEPQNFPKSLGIKEPIRDEWSCFFFFSGGGGGVVFSEFVV